jgi:methionyl-tRNA synthetase
LLEAVRLVAVLSAPVIPRAAVRIFTMLGLGEREPVTADLAWGRLEPGTPLGAIAQLFPRVDKTQDSKENAVSDSKPPSADQPTTPASAGAASAAVSPTPATPAGDRIDIAEFAKVELRAARVTAAERIAGSKKLVKLQVDLGHEQRTLVAGIAEAYEADALVGRHVAIVANLKPAKLMGIESNGMVLAASPEGGKPILVAFDVPPPLGTRVR